jgi:surface antigen
MRATLAVGAILAAVALASGCAARGITLDKIAQDRSIITGSTGEQSRPDPTQDSDEATIRNAVTSVDLEGLGVGESIGWNNTRTGSRGRVVEISEFREAGRPCRRFRTTRESYDGVALFAGEACLLSGSEWTMLSFRPL